MSNEIILLQEFIKVNDQEFKIETITKRTGWYHIDASPELTLDLCFTYGGYINQQSWFEKAVYSEQILKPKVKEFFSFLSKNMDKPQTKILLLRLIEEHYGKMPAVYKKQIDASIKECDG